MSSSGSSVTGGSAAGRGGGGSGGSGGGGGGGAAANPSTGDAPVSLRAAKLRDAFAKTLVNWRVAVAAASERGSPMADAFPAIYPAGQRGLDELYDMLWARLESYMKDELDTMLREAGIPGKLAEVERLRDQAEGNVLVEPATIMPEEEMRARTVEAKRAHMVALQSILDRMAGDNDALEAEVAEADTRAKRVTAAVAASQDTFKKAAESCGPFLDAAADSGAGAAAKR